MKNKKAFVLVAAIIILVLLAALGIFSVSLLSTDIEIASDTLRSAEALFLAEAGLQYTAENLLSGDSDWSDNPNLIKHTRFSKIL